MKNKFFKLLIFVFKKILVIVLDKYGISDLDSYMRTYISRRRILISIQKKIVIERFSNKLNNRSFS